jgi:hypothetical protein
MLVVEARFYERYRRAPKARRRCRRALYTTPASGLAEIPPAITIALDAAERAGKLEVR